MQSRERNIWSTEEKMQSRERNIWRSEGEMRGRERNMRGVERSMWHKIRRGWSAALFCVALFLCTGTDAYAQRANPYLFEIGLQGGIGYYSGDATPYIFMNPREAFGLQFRYKHSKRWAFQAKINRQTIAYNKGVNPLGSTVFGLNELYNIDATAEYNFLRFGSDYEYDDRVKPFTPYIFLGVGTGVYESWWKQKRPNDTDKDVQGYGASFYIPFGIGFKWMFCPRWGLNIAWQHNIYFADNIEGKKDLNDPNGLNGWNIMNMDLTGMLTVGIVIEFSERKGPCLSCDE